MRGNSTGRRSSTNPVRISSFEREDRSLTRVDSKKSLSLKSKQSVSTGENSHIPRPRLRASSSDRASIRGLTLKTTGRTPLHHGSTTPRTPRTNTNKHSTLLSVGSSNRIHAMLPTGRRSLSADRASSLGAKGIKKDTRPLMDKVYQLHMLTKIDNYFSINHLSNMLNSNGSLKPLTLKMFVEVSAHLVKTLDIKQSLTIANYVEELPKIAKKLHYPGVINKSWLKTANATLSLPNALGWICWLVEICQVREIASKNFDLHSLPFVGDETEAKMNRKAFLALLGCYNAWNDEKLEEEAAMVEKYLQEIENEQGVDEEHLKYAQFELDETIAKFQVIEEDANKIDDEVRHLQELLLSYQNDEKKQLKSIEEKEEYIKNINFHIDNINSESNVICEQIRLQEMQKNELISVIKEQPMSKSERDKIKKQCSELQNYIAQFDEHLEEIEKELYAIDIKHASINNTLTKTILKYNNEIFMHLPGDIGVNLEELKMPEKTLSDSQIMEQLKAKADLMDNVQDMMKKQLAQKEHSIELKSTELENLQENIKILEEENNDLATKIEEKKCLMKKIKADVTNEEVKLKEQINVLQNDIETIENQIPDKEKLAVKLEEAEDKLNAVQRKKAYIEESAKLFFDQFNEILSVHRNETINMLRRLE